MNDSKDLNEKKEGVVNTTPKTDNNSSEAEKPKEENNILSGEIVSMILDKEVTVKFSNNERGTLPYDKFKEKPMVGDIVKVRLEDKNGIA